MKLPLPFEFHGELDLILIITTSVPRWGSNPEPVGPKSWALPLGHTDCWEKPKVTQLYIANPLVKLRKSEKGKVRNRAAARKFSSAQLCHAPSDPWMLFYNRQRQLNLNSTQL